MLRREWVYVRELWKMAALGSLMIGLRSWRWRKHRGLAMAAKDMNTKQESFVMLVCAAVSLTGSSAALGFFVGIVLYLLLKLREVECRGFGFCGSNHTKSSLEDEQASLIA